MATGMNFINLFQNEYSFEEKINENFKKVDMFSTLSIKAKITYLIKDVEDDTLYLVDDNTDDYLSDKIGQIACYNSNIGWFFYVPRKGDILFLQDEKKFYFYDDEKWEELQCHSDEDQRISECFEKIETDCVKKKENLADVEDKTIAREVLEVYSKGETYNKNEIDSKILDIITGGDYSDVFSFLRSENNLNDLQDISAARKHLDVYSKQDTYIKTEVDEKIEKIIEKINEGRAIDESLYLLSNNNFNDLKDKVMARNNLEVYSINDVYCKDETYSKNEIDDKIYNKEEIDDKIKDLSLPGATNASSFILKDKNLSDLQNKETARNNLYVYSISDTYSKKEIDRKFLKAQIKEIDASAVMLNYNNLNDLTNMSKARDNLDVYSTSDVYRKNETYNKNEINKKIEEAVEIATYSNANTINFVRRDYNLLDLENIENARANLDVYSKRETFDRSKNFLDVLDQDSACHNIGTLRDWEIHRIGDYKMSAVKTDHDSWLICDGREISRTEYSQLFELIGEDCGAGDGETTFNLPDFRNRTMWGASGNLNSKLSSGLPNITGSQRYGVTGGEEQIGAIYSPPLSLYYMSVTNKGGMSQSNGISFDASKSNPIYGSSDIVQPPALCVNVFIKAK